MATRKDGANNSPGRRRAARGNAAPSPEPRTYDHPEAKTLLRPDVGTQAGFREKKPGGAEARGSDVVTIWTPPTPAEVEEKIQEMVRRILAGFDPEKIILFGSRARGDAGPDSDVDLLVVMETESKRDAAVKIAVELHAIGVPKDVMVITPEEFERRKDISGTIAYPAHHEGRILYERSRP